MTNSPLNSKDTYELMENDDGEIMVLIYAGDDAPQKPVFSVNEKTHAIELLRTKDDLVQIAGLQPESIEKLKKLKTLYICELKYNEDPEAESEILHAYAAALKKKSTTRSSKVRRATPKGKSLRKSPQSKTRSAKQDNAK